MATIDPRVWLSTKEAAALIGRSVAWLSRARAGKHPGPVFYQNNNRFLYAEQDVVKFIESRRVDLTGVPSGTEPLQKPPGR